MSLRLIKKITIAASAMLLLSGISQSYGFSKECIQLREQVCKYGSIDAVQKTCANYVGAAGSIGGIAGGGSMGCLIGGAIGAGIGSIGLLGGGLAYGAAVGCALGGGAGATSGIIAGGVGLSQLCKLVKSRYDHCVKNEKLRIICPDLTKTM